MPSQNPTYMSKKLVHIRYFKYSHWDLEYVFNPSHLKRKITTSFHLLKASPFKIQYFCGLNLGHDLIPTENNYLSKSYFTTTQFNDSTENVTLLSSIYSIMPRCKVQTKKTHHFMATLSNIFTSRTKITARLLSSSSSLLQDGFRFQMLYSYRKISGHTVPQALERAGKGMKEANIIIYSVTHHILRTMLESYKTTPV